MDRWLYVYSRAPLVVYLYSFLKIYIELHSFRSRNNTWPNDHEYTLLSATLVFCIFPLKFCNNYTQKTLKIKTKAKKYTTNKYLLCTSFDHAYLINHTPTYKGFISFLFYPCGTSYGNKTDKSCCVTFVIDCVLKRDLWQ